MHSCSVLRPTVTELACNRRLLIENDAQVERNSEDRSVEPEYRRSCNQAPTRNAAEHSNVHGITDEPIKPDDYKLPGWVPRCQRSFADFVEVAHARQQNTRAKEQYRPTQQCAVRSPTIAA